MQQSRFFIGPEEFLLARIDSHRETVVRRATPIDREAAQLPTKKCAAAADFDEVLQMMALHCAPYFGAGACS
jgi:hypothetical protein